MNFSGWVMSDWGALHNSTNPANMSWSANTVTAADAGLDQQMPRYVPAVPACALLLLLLLLLTRDF